MVDGYVLCRLPDDNQWEDTGFNYVMLPLVKRQFECLSKVYLYAGVATLQGTPLGCCPYYLISINVLWAKLVPDMGVDGYVSRQCTAPLALLWRDVAV